MSDIWGSIKTLVGKVAPILGNAILPGAGGVAGSLLAEALGTDNDPKAIETALINATPDQLARIKEITYKHEERLMELSVEQDKAYLGDRQDARGREMEIVKATGKRDINLYVLAWVVVLGFFILCGYLMNKSIPEGQNEVVFLLFGSLAAGFGAVIQYFFGSSKGSSDKTALLASKKE